MSWTLNAPTRWPGRNPDFTSAASDTAAATINNAADETNTRFIRRSSIVPVRNSATTRLPVSTDSIAFVDGLSSAGEWEHIKKHRSADPDARQWAWSGSEIGGSWP